MGRFSFFASLLVLHVLNIIIISGVLYDNSSSEVTWEFTLVSNSNTELTSTQLHFKPTPAQHFSKHLRYRTRAMCEPFSRHLTTTCTQSWISHSHILCDVNKLLKKCLKLSKDRIYVTFFGLGAPVTSQESSASLVVMERILKEDDISARIQTNNGSHMDEHSMKLSTSRSRRRRDVMTSARARRERRYARHCALRDLWVDFEELGWSQWIVHPRKYNARTCTGRCPSPVDWMYEPTNHAMIQSMVRLGDKRVERPCCVPITLERLSVLYLDGQDLVVRRHSNMIASKCGCR